jgi:AbiV family abortive infection protein
MLHQAAFDVEDGDGVNWHRLGSDLHSHEAKLTEILRLDNETPGLTRSEGYEALSRDLRLVREYLKAKNKSLYVGLADGGFVAPSAHVTRDEAMGLIRLEKRRLEAFEQTVN